MEEIQFYPLMGENNGNKASTLKGKSSAAIHLNNYCLNKNLIQPGESFKDVDPAKASDVNFYKEFGGYITLLTYQKKNKTSGAVEEVNFSPYTALQYYSSGKELMKEHFKTDHSKEFWSMESYQKGDNHLGANEYWSTPIRDHMMKILVERTQKAGDKLIDKSLPFGPKEKFDISNAFLHSKETSAPKNRALFNFMNQACGRYAKKNSHHNFDLHAIC